MLRRRHGRGCSLCLERPEAVGQSFNIGNPRSSVTIYDLATARSSGSPARRRDRLPAAALRRRRAAHPERREGARAARLRGAGRSRRGPGADDRVVPERALTASVWRGPTSAPRSSARSREVLESGMLTMGPRVPEFEEGSRAPARSSTRSRSRRAPRRSTSRCSRSGSEPGDEVLVPAYTFPATANVVALAGAAAGAGGRRPGDDEPRSGACSAVGPRTKAILAVHLFGRPRGSEELPELPVLEDAAGALGARWRGMPCGGLGVLGCLSFHPRKIVSTGEGGAVTTMDGELADAVRRLRNHGGARPTDGSTWPARLQLPALGRALCDRALQLRRLEELLGARDRIAEGVRGATRRPRRALPRAERATVHGWQAYVVQLDGGTRRWRRCGRRGSRRRSGRTRCSCSAPTATRATSPAPMRASSARSRCRSTRG